MDKAEALAKQLIATLEPKARLSFATEQSHGEADFHLAWPDGRSAVVEVTQATNQRLLQLLAVLGKGRYVKADQSAGNWLVVPKPRATIKTIRSSVDMYLAKIEAAGLSDFNFEIHAGLYPSVADIHAKLGIEAGYRVAWKEPKQIVISSPGGGGPLDVNLINGAVEHELRKPDNLRKLASSNASERHLFVVIDPSSDIPWTVLHEDGKPDAPPSIPKGITHVWAVGCTGKGTKCRVLRVEAGGHWTDLGYIPT